jgi:hypothetical protein
MKRPPVSEKKLGRECAAGIAYYDPPRIVIDPRQKQRERLDTVLHEGLHIAFPSASEKKIKSVAGMLSHIVWRDRYRRIEK